MKSGREDRADAAGFPVWFWFSLNLAMMGIFATGTLRLAYSTAYRPWWPSAAFYPLALGVALTGMVVLFAFGRSPLLYAVRVLVVLAEAGFVLACLYGVQNSAISSCGWKAPAEVADLPDDVVSMSADTLSWDGHVTCQIARTDGSGAFTYRYPLLDLLTGTLRGP